MAIIPIFLWVLSTTVSSFPAAEPVIAPTSQTLETQLTLGTRASASGTYGPAASASRTPYSLKQPPLDTPWTSEVGTNPWPQHPRPRLFREGWTTLNGIWAFQFANSTDELANPPSVDAFTQEVLVPSCVEGGISGIMAAQVTYMWFATTFEVPEGWNRDNRVVLIFEAVDYEATVFVNGQKVAFNRGGYFRFTVDVTDQVRFGQSNEVKVFVFDPTDEPPHFTPRGKQTRRPSHIFYTPCSGIWQSVWLESVPETHIKELDIVADMKGDVKVTVHGSTNQSVPVEIALLETNGNMLVNHKGFSGQVATFHLASPKLWSPDTPNLYNITVKMGDDHVRSYTAFRTISSGEVKGIKRPLLNGKFVFQFGPLDQGYWPDGIYTPPTLEAMVYDLEIIKALGMNMVRKHIKIEPDLFYEACDRMGLLVIQDMPSMLSGDQPPPLEAQAEFERQLDLMVTQFKGYPSIVTWVIYNEGWGQLRDGQQPEFRLTARVRELDPTRLINAVTGWHDHGAGDFHDNHHYADPQCGTPWSSLASTPYDPNRIGFQGEYGGLGHVPDHENLWPVQAAVDAINQTYEINVDLPSYHYRSHVLFGLLRDQVALHACSGAVYTQTTDVEGEVNGLVTYDRRVTRVDVDQWKEDIQALYDAAENRA